MGRLKPGAVWVCLMGAVLGQDIVCLFLRPCTGQSVWWNY